MPPSALQRRIPTSTAWAMAGVAALVDIIQLFSKPFAFIPVVGMILIPIMGIFLSLFSGLLYWFWFRINDVGFFDRQFAKGMVYIGNFFIELIPIVNGLWPGWTVATIVTIWLVRREDRAYNEKQAQAAGSRRTIAQRQ